MALTLSLYTAIITLEGVLGTEQADFCDIDISLSLKYLTSSFPLYPLTEIFII